MFCFIHRLSEFGCRCRTDDKLPDPIHYSDYMPTEFIGEAIFFINKALATN